MKDDRTKLLLIESTLYEYRKHQPTNSNPAIAEQICKDIAEGKYDHLVKPEPTKPNVKRVNIKPNYAKKAREKAKALGYQGLAEMVNEVMKSELAQVK